MARMDRALRAAGYETLNLDYPSRRMGLEELAVAIHPAVSAFAETAPGPVHFVTHSMGGLLARLYLARFRPRRLGRVVMLAPPNQGSEIADLLERTWLYRTVYGPAGAQLGTRRADALAEALGPVDYPVGIIAGDRSIDPLCWVLIPGPNDGKVGVARTRLEGSADHVTLHTTHPTILLNREAIAETLTFLETGRFRQRPR
jgi:pimeloyl-ACP methyl ester carboxylesterase